MSDNIEEIEPTKDEIEAAMIEKLLSMNRKDKLEMLQGLVIDNYILALAKGQIHFRDMSPIVSLLNQNSIVEEKGKSSIEEEVQKRIREAEERRKNGS